MSDESRQTRHEFDEAVNMTARELRDWLGTEESREVGQSDGRGESTGHAMGRHIVDILGKKQADLTDTDART